MSRSRVSQASRSGVLAVQRLTREQGTVIKDWGGRMPVALAYPNSYYLGMSNLGIHTVYGLLNSRREVVCERVFLEKDGAGNPIAPVAVESGRPLRDFSVIAFSVSYELDYFNVVSMLRAASIPLRAADRDESHPLVIAGGPCITANPMPLAPFFDCLCIGEAEAILPGLLPALLDGINDKRQDLLKGLAATPGLYVPACHNGNPVIRQWTKNLDEHPSVSVVLTPDTELGSLYLIEAERGCSHGCRFCLVGTVFSPMRFRSTEKLLEQAGFGLQYRKRIGLVGPAVSDHPQIEEIIDGLLAMGGELSISSLRIGAKSGRLLPGLIKGGVQTVTMAPEAGSQRMRDIINKGISEEEILTAIDNAAASGIRQLKLYFIIGLPGETDEDVQAIIDLTLAGKAMIEKRKSGTRLTLNIAPFVPKAGTPFQWLPVAPLPVLNQRLAWLKKALPPQGIRINSESPAWSQVQAVLSRGDSAIAGVLTDIEEMTLAGWRRAAEKNNLDIDYYAHRKWDRDTELPWGFIDSGIKPEKPGREMGKALN
ncbi:radical SAM protein [Chloroflexota bacterium]